MDNLIIETEELTKSFGKKWCRENNDYENASWTYKTVKWNHTAFW